MFPTAPGNYNFNAALADEEGTYRLMADIAAVIERGDVITLSGDLGAGKTTFARALIRFFAGDESIEVPSPTFTLTQTYVLPRFRLVHADLYRLSGPAELAEIGLEDAAEDAVLVIEWPDRAGALLPADRLDVAFTLAPQQGANTRNARGAILAAVVPLALAAAIDEGWWRAGEVAALFVFVEPLTAYVVEPLLYGHSTGLAPISVIVAAVFWTWLWGPIGLILSTPLTLCFVVLGRHVKSLEFFDVLLGDRPALAPSEAVYQRILSDNPDDVLEKAERLLSERTLLEYYDQVVLPALELAADDEARGVIPAGRAAVMTRSMLDVIADLAEHQDVSIQTATRDAGELSGGGTPLPSGGVACVAGHGAFDDAVAAMLSQLLERMGVPSRPVPYIDASRERIAALDLAGVSVVAVSYLDLKGPTATLRYLVRRIRQHAPDVTIIVGLWPAGETDAAETTRQTSIGADLCVASLREAVEAASRAAQGKRGRPT